MARTNNETSYTAVRAANVSPEHTVTLCSACTFPQTLSVQLSTMRLKVSVCELQRRLLGLDKDTVNRVILRAGEHCAAVLSSLLASLALTEAQLDELWTFVKKKKVLEARKTPKGNMAARGSGQR